VDPAVSPGVSNPSQQSSRERILKAALALMSEKGYAGTSMSMLTKRSGLRPSSTYWHFGNKEELLAAVVEYSADRWLSSLPRWADLHGAPDERLRQLLAASQAGTGEEFLRLLMLLALEHPLASGEWVDTIRRVRHSAAGGFRKAFDEINGIPSDDDGRRRRDESARFALAAVDGIFFATQIDDDVDVDRMFSLLEQCFLGLCAPRPPARD
jgi:AcrR family transcriptional regulator